MSSQIKVEFLPGFLLSEDDVFEASIDGVVVGRGDTPEAAIANIAARQKRAEETRAELRALGRRIDELSQRY